MTQLGSSLFLTLLVALVSPTNARDAIYYIAPAGTTVNGTGTPQNPYGGISEFLQLRGMDVASPTTLYFMPGTHKEAQVAKVNVVGSTLTLRCQQGAIITFTLEVSGTGAFQAFDVVAQLATPAFIILGGTASFTRSYFAHNTNQGNGGAVALEEGCRGGHFESCTFVNNTSIQNGGAVSNFALPYDNGKRAPPVTFTNCHFKGNEATVGGAVYVVDSTTTFSSCNFTQNVAVNGGAIFVPAGVIMSSNFSANRASSYGGAVYEGAPPVDATGPLTISASLFENNMADYGGALACSHSKSTLILRHCRLKKNSGSVSGGAVYSLNSAVNASLCIFEENSVLGDDGGGALFLASSVGTSHNNTFEYNVNNSPYAGGGGAISLSGNTKVSFSGDLYLQNYAQTGGAFRLTQGKIDAKFAHCTFTENHATSQALGFGGAMEISSTSAVSFKACQFLRNNAQLSGGAVHTSSLTLVSFTGCLFSKNKAVFGGGAVALTSGGRTAYAPLVVDSIFELNSAILGGALLIAGNTGDTDPTVQGSLFSQNFASGSGGAVHIKAGEVVALEGCEFRLNSVGARIQNQTKVQVSLDSGASVKLSGSSMCSSGAESDWPVVSCESGAKVIGDVDLGTTKLGPNCQAAGVTGPLMFDMPAKDTVVSVPICICSGESVVLASSSGIPFPATLKVSASPIREASTTTPSMTWPLTLSWTRPLESQFDATGAIDDHTDSGTPTPAAFTLPLFKDNYVALSATATVPAQFIKLVKVSCYNIRIGATERDVGEDDSIKPWEWALIAVGVTLFGTGLAVCTYFSRKKRAADTEGVPLEQRI